ncbi:MAG: methyl-accepting chemotaxis protein, partial [Spirochaetota bacterium]
MSDTASRKRNLLPVMAIFGALLLLCLIAILFFPALSFVAGILGLVSAILVLISAGLGVRRTAASERAEGKASAAAVKVANTRSAVIDLLMKSRIHQEELASEIMGTIRLAAGISQRLLSGKKNVESFDDDFGAAGFAVVNIRELVERFNAQVTLLAQSSEQAAAASEEMAASIERMSKESGDRYEEVKDLADMSRMGQDEMKTSLSVIRQVSSSVDALNSFIGTINDIAERTALLAMNAAIQAAHAGEAGRGFAVVAGEVRKLAASSAESAGAISSRLAALITTIKKAEETSVNSSQIFSIVEEKVQRATDSFFEIRNGTDELALAGREIRDAVASLKGISVGIKDASEEVSESVRGLDDRIGHLKEVSSDIVGNLGTAQDEASRINLSALATSQSDVAQLKIGDAVLARSSEGRGVEESGTALLTIQKLQHVDWIARVRAVLDGKLQIETASIPDHHSCELGLWMEGEGR